MSVPTIFREGGKELCNVSSSKARGNGISIATVGENSYFTDFAQDIYKNDIQFSNNAQALETHGISMFPFTGQVVWNGSEYHVVYAVTYQGFTSLCVFGSSDTSMTESRTQVFNSSTISCSFTAVGSSSEPLDHHIKGMSYSGDSQTAQMFMQSRYHLSMSSCHAQVVVGLHKYLEPQICQRDEELYGKCF